MVRKNQVILLHGNKDFKSNKPSDFVKGELAIEHGSNDAKLFTLNDANEVVTFVSEAVVDAKVKVATDAASTNAGAITTINGKLEIIQGTEATDGSIAKALKDAKEYANGLATNYDAAGAADAAKSAVIGQSGDASTVDTIYGAKKYADEKAGAAQSAGEGAAANALKDAKEYADSLVKKDGVNLFDDKGAADAAKSDVIGQSGDAKTANTIYGAKKYADEVAAAAQTAGEGAAANALKDAKEYADSLVKDTNGVNLFDDKGAADAAKSDVIGQSGDASTVDTIYGAKKYADEAVATLGTEIDGEIEAIEGNIETLQTAVGKDGEEPSGLYKKIADAQAAATSVVSSTSDAIIVTKDETAEDGHVEYKLSLEGIATDSALSTLQGKVETLIGKTDSNKSVRTIVKEEIDVQLDPEGLNEAFDTLTTVAEYIAEHKEEVNAVDGILARISNIETDITDNVKENITTNASAIETLQGKDSDTKESVSIVGAKKYADSLVKDTNGVNLFDDKGAADAAKSDVIGQSGDASTVDTIYGAKKYADEQAGKVQTSLNSVAENYIKTITDAKGNTFSATNNIVNLSTMVIDCGEY